MALAFTVTTIYWPKRETPGLTQHRNCGHKHKTEGAAERCKAKLTAGDEYSPWALADVCRINTSYNLNIN